jgi:hypothetical protein
MEPDDRHCNLLASFAVFLIAVPVLLFGELLMETRFRAVFTHIRRAGLLGQDSRGVSGEPD